MATSLLLPMHKSILMQVHSTQTSDLVILARGLGLSTIVCTLLQLYDSPKSLVIVIGATPAEETALRDELGVMGCRNPGLRVVTYEMTVKDRRDLYRQGGLISITSRILIVDMLLGDIPVELIGGVVILHADKVTPHSTEAFIVRVLRQKNDKAFLKAFTDEPEQLTVGFSPLKDVMKELQVRNVHIYPRFHEDIRQSLERRKGDVVQIAVPMTRYMRDIHSAIIQCIEQVLSDLKRNNTELNLDDLNIQTAYFRNFDLMARQQLNSVWHRVGFRTKQLVGDLSTLRRLLGYLLSYDPLGFQAYIDTMIASASTTAAGNPNFNRSDWIMTPTAEIIFSSARRRCFLSERAQPRQSNSINHDEEWEILDEMTGQRDGKEKRPNWLPNNIKPVLEEPPKWEYLVETLLEIEELIMHHPPPANQPGTNTVLIMCSSDRTAAMIREFLSTMDGTAAAGQKGRKFMESKLKNYLFWKGMLGKRNQNEKKSTDAQASTSKTSAQNGNVQTGTDSGISEALKRKDARTKQRVGQRRRVRGGGPGSTERETGATERTAEPGSRSGPMGGQNVLKEEAEELALFLEDNALDSEDIFLPGVGQLTQLPEFTLGDDDENYGLVAPEQLVVVRSYSDDMDSRILSELQPRFIILYEPSLDFVRRIEVYRAERPGLSVRVYVLMWETSAEEDRYLAGLRREKEAFEQLIKERASMVLVLQEKSAQQTRTDAMIRTISSRNAGGSSIVEMGQPLVVVDVREFRSSLPGLLHLSGTSIYPITLTVGDYVLTPDMVVERKSVPDLVQSFNSGRLYTQCELMSAHYKEPLLLIEFEQDKSFALQTLLDAKSNAKVTNKFPLKKGLGPPDADMIESTSVQSKLVLLSLAFPRLRIIWSSSPYATAEIFADLKRDNSQPDAKTAVSIGAEGLEEDAVAGAGWNAAAEELLRSLPGVTGKNVRYVMGMVGSIRELCELDEKGVQAILGVEQGKVLHAFLHKGER